MIRRIILDNFMSHVHTVIEPAAGLTVLVGPNNCGKSAVVAALQAVCENTKTAFMVRHGAKEAAVTIETDDGHVISWRRTEKSAAYIIDGVRNDRPQEDCLARVHAILKLPKVKEAADAREEFDVHFAQQKWPIFLLDDSGMRAASFFASSSDAERLLRMQRLHANRVTDDKRESQRCSALLTKLDADLALLAPLDEIAPRVGAVEQRFAQLRDEQLSVMRLEDRIGRLRSARQRVARHGAERDATRSLAAPPLLADERGLDRLIGRYRAIEARRAAAAQKTAALSPLNPPPIITPTRAIEQRIAQLRLAATRHERASAQARRLQEIPQPPALLDVTLLEQRLAKLRQALVAVQSRESQLAAAGGQLLAQQRSIEAWARQHPTCPLCNGPVDAARLLATAASPEGAHHHA
jgi:exonuclease SbcC